MTQRIVIITDENGWSAIEVDGELRAHLSSPRLIADVVQAWLFQYSGDTSSREYREWTSQK